MAKSTRKTVQIFKGKARKVQSPSGALGGPMGLAFLSGNSTRKSGGKHTIKP